MDKWHDFTQVYRCTNLTFLFTDWARLLSSHKGDLCHLSRQRECKYPLSLYNLWILYNIQSSSFMISYNSSLREEKNCLPVSMHTYFTRTFFLYAVCPQHTLLVRFLCGLPATYFTIFGHIQTQYVLLHNGYPVILLYVFFVWSSRHRNLKSN